MYRENEVQSIDLRIIDNEFMLANPYLRVAIPFGLLCAVLVLIYFFTLNAIGNSALAEMNRLDILIILLCALFAMGYYRDRRNGGVLHFWQGIIIGLAVELTGILVSTLIIYITVQVKPEIFTEFTAEMEKLIRADYQAGRIKDAAYFQRLLASVSTLSPLGKAADIFGKSVFLCFLATGVLSIIMRKHVR